MTLDEKIKAIADAHSNMVFSVAYQNREAIMRKAIYLGIRAYLEQELAELFTLEAAATPAPWHPIRRGVANDPYIFAPSDKLGLHGPVILSGMWPTHENTPEATEQAEAITFANTALVAALRNALPKLRVAIKSLPQPNE